MVAYDLWSTREVHRSELCPGAFPHLPTDQWTPRQHSRLAELRHLGAVPGALSISFSLVVPFPLRRFLTHRKNKNPFQRDGWTLHLRRGVSVTVEWPSGPCATAWKGIEQTPQKMCSRGRCSSVSWRLYPPSNPQLDTRICTACRDD